jgi:hypothetical protein
LSGPDERFSIDGSWLLDDDGRLYLFRCLDFVGEADPPHGTGIVVQAMRDPLTPAGPPAVVLRAHADWHLFQADREMPLYGGRRFERWTTIEGPAPVRRGGRYYCGYSGGNYAGAYGTGEAVAEAPLGPYADLRGREGPLFATVPGLVEGPGHFSVVRPDLVNDWIVLHGRRPVEAGRRVWLCPARWGPQGVEIGPLTDRPQPAPPLPGHAWRFALDGPAALEGWRLEGGGWSPDAEGLRHAGVVRGAAWRGPGPEAGADWAAEVFVALPGPGAASARVGGLSLGLEAGPGSDVAVVVEEGGVGARRVEAPTLGDEAFRPGAFHALGWRCRGGRVEARVDGVVVAAGVPVARRAAGIGLEAEGSALFDALSVTIG